MKLKTLIQDYGFTKVVDEDLDIIMYERVIKDLTFLCGVSDTDEYWKGTDEDLERDVVVSIYESSDQITITSYEDLSIIFNIFNKSEGVPVR